ncbi:MAG TPA: ACT domain-containing protein, partial [Acidimicrobiales bacterium]|nr:ACT domain-containing protein [Acidimicrobiales bacterium]
MPLFAIAAVGADRPGIVAGVTGVLVQHGCNLEDSSMSILRGHFAIMLVVAGPTGLDAATLEAALSVPAEEMDLVVVVREIDEAVTSSREGEPWTVAVYGADRPGIVHGV